MAAVWPRRSKNSRPVCASQTTESVVAVAGGQQHAVGAELDGGDPLGVLFHLEHQGAVGRVVDPDDLARARRGPPGRDRG